MTPICGIVAQETEQVPVIPPIAAFATADFVNGIYDYNGATLTASQVVNNTGAISGSGLHLTTGGSGIQILNDFRAKLFTFDWSIVLHLNINVFSENEHRILNVGSETAAPFGYTNEVIAIGFGDWEFEDKNNDFPGTPPGTGTSYDRFIDDFTHGLNDGIHKFGITRTNNFISLAVDGNPAETLSAPGPFHLNVGPGDARATFGAYRFIGETVPNGFYVRSLKIYYPAVNDAALVGLTAP